jgi:hypothetical protein
MISAVNYLWETAAAGLSYLFTSPDIMVEMPPFGANDWKVHFGVDIKAPAVPEHIQKEMEEPCPSFPGKLKKETHLLCLVPDRETLEKLNVPFLNEYMERYKAVFPKQAPYWILITKEVMPSSTRSLRFDRQIERISKLGYDAPYLVEVAVAVIAAKIVGDFYIFPLMSLTTICEPNFTLCHEECEESGGWFSSDRSGHITVGSSHREVSIKRTYGISSNGMAGVVR